MMDDTKRRLPRLAVVQMDATTGDKERNLAKASEFIADAARQGADLVLLPELFSTGYRADEAFGRLAESAEGPTVQALTELARRHNVWIAGGMAEVSPDSERPYNSLVMVNADGLQGSYRKAHLWGAESRFFMPGDSPTVIQTPLGSTGLLICYDISFPEMARTTALQGARILLYSLAMGPDERAHVLHAFAQARAVENLAYVAVANRVGEERGTRFCGGSEVVGPDGHSQCSLQREEGVAVADVDPALPDQFRERYPYFRDRRSGVYRI